MAGLVLNSMVVLRMKFMLIIEKLVIEYSD